MEEKRGFNGAISGDFQSALPRVLEPEVMATAEEVREYLDMTHSGANQSFVDDLISGGTVGPRVLDLGCGTAEIPVLLCQTLSEVEVLGIDASVEMLEAAKIEIELAGMAGRIALQHDDCKQLESYESGMADTVISNSLCHHVPEPNVVLQAAIHLVSPGGRVFIRDLFRPSDDAAVEQLVELHAGNESDFAKQLLRQSLHAALTPVETRQIVIDLGLPADCVAVTSDRHWTIDWSKPA